MGYMLKIEKLSLQLSLKYENGLDGTLVTCLPIDPMVVGFSPGTHRYIFNSKFLKHSPHIYKIKVSRVLSHVMTI